MKLIIYRPVPSGEVQPLSSIHSKTHGVLVVDEVTRRASEVQIAGRPPERTEGNRLVDRWEPQELVRVRPGPDDEIALIYALDAALNVDVCSPEGGRGLVEDPLTHPVALEVTLDGWTLRFERES